ncbi:AKAP7 2'5' RNA ligase-like domain-containing protein [Pyrenochaeta sp. MPI-SDFR-AT-0127]|nr:AKAP7 2'5' RNA ligase-like domain-containing protein [Pyrenochaeta sp. MPI-SDFR-AT-0127]
MGKKKTKGEYNDFLDGEKLRDNTEIRTSLQGSNSVTRNISPPSVRHDRKGSKKGHGGLKKPPLTHFLCLPLITEASRPLLQAGLERLKEDLEKEDLVPSKAVRPVGTLHLTLGVMSLDNVKLEEAKQYLQNLDLHSLLRDISTRKLAEKAAEDGIIAENLSAAAFPDTEALTIDLESLVPMQAPSKTSILYAEPRDASQRLLPFASQLKNTFTESGLLLEDTRPLRLHATIINTIYAKFSGQRGRKKSLGLKDTLKHIEHKVSPHHHHTSGNAKDFDDSASLGAYIESEASTVSTSQDSERREGHGPDAKSWLSFDARPLIERYKEFSWADGVQVDRVQICKMGAKKVWSGGDEGRGEMLDERYEVVAEKKVFE